MFNKLILFAIAMAHLNSACGKKKATQEEKDKKFADALHMDDQNTCNARKKFYDNSNNVCLDAYNLATWSCSRDGLIKRLNERDPLHTVQESDSQYLTALDKKIAEGFQFHQCGDGVDGSVALMLYKRVDEDSGMSITLLGAKFDAPLQPYLQFETSLMVEANQCDYLRLLYVMPSGDSQGTISPAPTDKIATVVISNASNKDAANLYADATCLNPATTIAIKQGEKSALVYVKSTVSQNFEVNSYFADGPADSPVASAVVNVY